MAIGHTADRLAAAVPAMSHRVLTRRRVLAAVGVLSCTALLALAVTRLDEGLETALFGSGGASVHEGSDITADVSGLRSLRNEVNSAVGENGQLVGEYSATFGAKAPCTSLRAGGCSAAVVDNYLTNINKATAGDPDAGCCGEENEGAEAAGSAPAAGDMSIGAVVKALETKFRKMKQQFRDVRADYYKGAPRDLTVKVSPRGPRGFTGPPGVSGGQGVMGEQGAIGPVGPRGYRGYDGDRGPIGRKGKKGMTGSIGEAGDMGGQGFQGAAGDVGFSGPPGSKGLPGATKCSQCGISHKCVMCADVISYLYNLSLWLSYNFGSRRTFWDHSGTNTNNRTLLDPISHSVVPFVAF